jgi:hypothetical protein
MPPIPASSERVVKKVSRGQCCCPVKQVASDQLSACNTCRLKRKKVVFLSISAANHLFLTQCDGLDPCAFCVENKLECLYSKEPRRRGPPSGYLRYTETRVAILEILLGLYLTKLPKKAEDDEQLFDPFLEIAQILQSEAKTCTQDVWDAHRARWSKCPSAKLVEELVVSFAPFTPRSAQEAPVKTLLPPPAANSAASTSAHAKDGGRKANDKSRNQMPFTSTLKPEAFESHDQLRDTASPISVRTQGETTPTPVVASNGERAEEWQDSAVAGPSFIHLQEQSVPLVYQTQSYQQGPIQLQHTASMGLGSTPDLGVALGLGDSQEYTGSYW